jgi:hypothetical protein
MAAKIRCPECGTMGATKFLWMVKCPNPRCSRYDAELRAAAEKRSKVPAGNFNPAQNAIRIQYTNAEGQQRSYTGDKTTIRKRHNHISIVLAPAGRRCSFEIRRIADMSAIAASLPQEFGPAAEALSPADRQVLSFHRRRGSTSPRYEELQRKIRGTA